MNNLNSYINIKETLNAALFALLPAGRPSGNERYLHFDNPQIQGDPLRLSTQQYPYTPLGTIGVQNLTDQSASVVTTQLNRHNQSTSSRSAAQLILLDTEDQALIEKALKRDARHTDGLLLNSSMLFGTSNADADWIITHHERVAKHLQGASTPQNNPNFSASSAKHLARLKASNQGLYSKVFTWLFWEHERTFRHGEKSATRLSHHYTNLSSDMSRAQQITETRGEYAAAKIMLTVLSHEYQMKMGKSPNGARPNGIDQIWVKRNLQTNTVEEYIIVESKGSYRAHLGHPADGAQMSPRWVFSCLISMAAGEASYIHTATTNTRLAKKMLNAMVNNTVPVRGLIFHSLHGTQQHSKIIHMTDLTPYNCPALFTQANAGNQIFANAPTTVGMDLDQ
ncbi:hypothetical protein SAMN05216601_11484 [Ectopseudomonas composti]|uniref:Uncharacterized protein n=1 Tax=Ectopseudomonas composti TaxID=658457 RepID=A0A1I5R6S7_9GAMM|nr:hypothetical protein [Pseudomonas composti]SFP54224.1 hypothetical protein SAMN05216601_11484 [Pseudomonas composti]